MIFDTLPFLTDKIRRSVYFVFAILGFVIGATQVGYGAAEFPTPVWLTVALAVYTFAGGWLGFTAADRVTRDPNTAKSLPEESALADVTAISDELS